MKYRVGIVVLVLVGLGLGIGLITVKRQADKQKDADTKTILTLTNDLVEAKNKFEEQKQVSTLLEKDLDKQKQSFGELTNSFSQVSENLAKTEASLKTSQEEITKLEAKTAELESQNQMLDKRAQDLTASITNLTIQIADTQKKLASSEGNRAFLEDELKRLMSEKNDLERQFKDINVLRAQVAKLKEEQNVARRLEWAKRGLVANSDQKGAQQLMTGLNAPLTPAKPAKPVYDLNVEVSSDGSVKVIPPVTNSPAATSPPPK
jgi:chromosome segregation ATPase